MQDKKYEGYRPEDETFQYYWETREEFIEWTERIQKQWQEFEQKGYEGIILGFDANSYSEYEATYTDVILEWTYQRDYTKEELEAIEKDRQQRREQAELYKLQQDCTRYLKANSDFTEDVIREMCRNVGVLTLFKQGKLKL